MRYFSKSNERKLSTSSFLAFDDDGDGEISRDEIKMRFKQFAEDIDDKALDKIFKHADASRSGYLSYGEFLSATIS